MNAGFTTLGEVQQGEDQWTGVYTGRVKRLWGRPMQRRFVVELRRKGITSMKGTNAFLLEYIEEFNSRFAVKPQNGISLSIDIFIFSNLQQTKDIKTALHGLARPFLEYKP